MKKIQYIIDIDRKIFETFQNFVDLLPQISKKYTLSKNLGVLMNFISSTNFVKQAVLDISGTDNNYALNILFRSLIEQYLKFQYIWFKMIVEKTEDIANDYFDLYSYSEDIDYAKAWSKSYEYTDQVVENDPIQIIKNSNPKFASISNSDLKERVIQFNYRNIIKYIIDKTKNQSDASNRGFLIKLIPKYSELSSFVHGGPNSHKYMLSSGGEEGRFDEAQRIVEMSVQIAAQVKSLTYLIILQHEQAVKMHYNDTNKWLKALLTQNEK